MSSHTDPTAGGDIDARAILRALADQPDNWPATADELLSRLSQASHRAVDSSEENDTLLSLVVDDALKGVDISRRYPVFFQRLLADDELRRAFLETLEAAENRAIPATAAAEPALSFLQTPARHAILEVVSPNRWRLRWQAALDQLQQLFFSADQVQPAYRAADYLEDAWFTLIRDEIAVDQFRASVLLEAARLMTSPDHLQLHLAVGLTPDRMVVTERLPELRAQLTWGTYDQTVTITQRGRATFPLLPLQLILDETTQHVTADLQLIVEPAL